MIDPRPQRDRMLQPIEPRPAAPAAGGAAPLLSSDALFAGHAELRIAHGGAVYRLRQTALGKLILTK